MYILRGSSIDYFLLINDYCIKQYSINNIQYSIMRTPTALLLTFYGCLSDL